MDGSAYWTVVGGIVVACIAAIGNIAVKVYEKWSARDFTQKGESLELERAHEGRPWAEMGRRLSDLREENEELRAEVERLRTERDQARLDAVDWEIAAKKANGALARVTEIQAQCDEERRRHAETVERLSAEIRRLRGDH